VQIISSSFLEQKSVRGEINASQQRQNKRAGIKENTGSFIVYIDSGYLRANVYIIRRINSNRNRSRICELWQLYGD
jgi:hypothetical protein